MPKKPFSEYLIQGILSLFLSDLALRLVLNVYERHRRIGASRWTAMCALFFNILSWGLLHREGESCRWIQHHRELLYPQLKNGICHSGDWLRALMQTMYLCCVQFPPVSTHASLLPRVRLKSLVNKIHVAVSRLYPKLMQWLLKSPEKRSERWLTGALISIAVVLGVLCITQPLEVVSQAVFVGLLGTVAILLRYVPGRFASMLLIVLSFTVSCRYMWWRYTSTLNWDDRVSLFFCILLLVAETYSWVVLALGYFQSLWPLNREPAAMPAQLGLFPSVDLMIPTYNEDLEVVKPTVYAALGMDWPKEKLTIYILDDGNRTEFREFAEKVGVRYIARPTHEHAKAGNINYALKQATSEFTAIFDCDHIPTRAFLQMTVGWFIKDPKLGMLQTPHHFFSPDPFERNLQRFRVTPNEGTLFYGLVQDGNDMWNATFFCGSCAVIRRSALDEIGGIAVETVTEDAHTSLRLHRLGYNSAYIRIPLAAGLATESLSAHIGQRIRWARGMVQILRLDNPLTGKGLKLSQRLCYFNAMLHFMSGIPRLIFLIAPLAFLLLHAYIIYAPALMITVFVLPHMFHANLTNSRLQGKYRHSFWSEIYETILAWYIARPTAVALINPHKGKFNVTAKGGLIEKNYLDWDISKPYLMLALLNACGLIGAVYRFMYGSLEEIPTVFISVAWVFYNLVVLGGSVAVAKEMKQLRRKPRVEFSMKAAYRLASGHLYSCHLTDYSDGGAGIRILPSQQLHDGDKIELILSRGEHEFSFPATVVRQFGQDIGLSLEDLSVRQHIEFIQCTFARADNWVLWQEKIIVDKPLSNLWAIIQLGFKGCFMLGEYLPGPFKLPFLLILHVLRWIGSFFPRPVTLSHMQDRES